MSAMVGTKAEGSHASARVLVTELRDSHPFVHVTVTKYSRLGQMLGAPWRNSGVDWEVVVKRARALRAAFPLLIAEASRIWYCYPRLCEKTGEAKT